MPLQAIKPDPDPQLAVALLVSAVLHAAVLLGVGFLAPDPGSRSGETLTMVDYLPESEAQSRREAREARSASRSQQARGTDATEQEATAPDAGRAPTPRRPAAADTPEPTPEAGKPAPAPPARGGSGGPERQPVLSTDQADSQVAAPEPEAERPQRPDSGGRSSRSFQLFPSDRQVARWDDERRQARAAADTPGDARTATRKEEVAAYTTSLLNKVQRIGNMNYPEEARARGITGKVRLQCHIRPDGSLAGVEVLESSGSEILDAGAKQIIRLAAPFSPFPRAMKASHPDSYTVSHYLNFTRDGELSEASGG